MSSSSKTQRNTRSPVTARASSPMPLSFEHDRSQDFTAIQTPHHPAPQAFDPHHTLTSSPTPTSATKLHEHTSNQCTAFSTAVQPSHHPEFVTSTQNPITKQVVVYQPGGALPNDHSFVSKDGGSDALSRYIAAGVGAGSYSAMERWEAQGQTEDPWSAFVLLGNRTREPAGGEMDRWGKL